MQRRLIISLAAATTVAGGLLTPTALAAAGSSTIPGGEPDPYCAAHVALEAAFYGEDPGAIGAAVDAAMAAVPAELADALQTAIDTGSTDGPPPPEFNEAYGQIASWVKDNCGFPNIDVLAREYSYGGLPTEMAAGPTVITFLNDGEEFHELLVLRRNEGVDDPVEDLLALPEEEVFSKFTFVGAMFTGPGTETYAVIDFTPGDYVGLCFLPVGATPEMMEQMMSEEGPPPDGSAPMSSDMTMTSDMTLGSDMTMGSEPMEGMESDGPPQHFMEGMIQEFTVTAAGAEAEAPAEAQATTG
ncbi:hypothetical protein BH24ACT5_BH24ACT5_21090 [soil metagenome]